MKPEIAKIWTEALRSGKYEQCTSVLRSTDNKFCCLGVLCELAVKESIIEPPVLQEKDYYIYEGTSYGVLPIKVQEWAGMKNTNGWYDVKKDSKGNTIEITALYKHNDVDKMTFDQIADIIEANVEKL